MASLAPASILSLALVLVATGHGPASAGVAITVNTTELGGASAGNCGLDEAINAANAGVMVDNCDGTVANTIEFALGTGTPLINVTTPLPSITAFVVINGNSGGATRVELRGDGSVSTGLTIANTGDDVTVRSMVIDSFTGMGTTRRRPVGMFATASSAQTPPGRWTG